MAKRVIVERIHEHTLTEFADDLHDPVHVLFGANSEYQVGKQYYLGPAFGGASDYFTCMDIRTYTDTVVVVFYDPNNHLKAQVSIPFHAVTEIRGIVKDE